MLLIQLIIGLIIGSFLFASYSRLQLGGSIFYPARSRCDSCSETISWFDLVPVVSYLVLRGRCRWCGFKISKETLYSEIYFGCLLVSWQPTLLRFCYVVIGGLLFFMALNDSRHFEFPAWHGYLLMLFAVTVYALFKPHHAIIFIIIVGWIVPQIWQPHFAWIGNGDLDVFLCLLILFGPIPFAWLLLLSSVLALIGSKVLKLCRLPFVPFIAAGYLVVLFFI
ncbi:prepilin peptidase [Lactobacillus sp. LC28-10]|uniref:Prepilin peptidase n=1 Tax=Secundilactobacillus angelensis TaxID=2722706 RepID=A0ABX1L1E9_9LACO|nr:A24 family peptidase [Secundilactobacillus angelensis]MCH5462802.1 prepilin peptidase [Secundilactobacillus angelensis]NLR19285.1 prepilin peptidase [Secundilactobacillus angelensis]